MNQDKCNQLLYNIFWMCHFQILPYKIHLLLISFTYCDRDSWFQNQHYKRFLLYLWELNYLNCAENILWSAWFVFAAGGVVDMGCRPPVTSLPAFREWMQVYPPLPVLFWPTGVIKPPTLRLTPPGAGAMVVLALEYNLKLINPTKSSNSKNYAHFTNLK